MKSFLKLTAATAACLFAANVASAQTGGDSQSDRASQQAPDAITCSEITMMDSALVPATLYYIAGYRHGSDKGTQGDSRASAQGSSDTKSSVTGDKAGQDDGLKADPSQAAGTGSETKTQSSDGSQSASSQGSDSQRSSDSDGSARAGTSGDKQKTRDNTAATSDADSKSSQGKTKDRNAADSGEDGDGAKLVRISGFYEIPVEEIVTVCREAPDHPVSDVIQEKSGKKKDSN